MFESALPQEIVKQDSAFRKMQHRGIPRCLMAEKFKEGEPALKRVTRPQ
jgi:hypothetical protein